MALQACKLLQQFLKDIQVMYCHSRLAVKAGYEGKVKDTVANGYIVWLVCKEHLTERIEYRPSEVRLDRNTELMVNLFMLKSLSVGV